MLQAKTRSVAAGGTGTIRANLRLIAATNKDLDLAIAAGTFREDPSARSPTSLSGRSSSATATWQRFTC
ncbi:MAG TPA: sigma 54-interacting transcriptional regulator [Vicinamibacterales bacterium]|nr:sigma 54-interacting transcriptional regulator [Vicinamibacterales bacterium]